MGNSEGLDLGYWLRWQVPVCALIFVVPPVIALRFLRRVEAEPLNSEDLWVSCWKELNPRWLLFFRAFAFVFMASLLSQIMAMHGAFAFYFYTQWTFALVMVYFALGTIISANGCWVCSHKPAPEIPPENEERTEFLKSNLEESGSTDDVTFGAKDFRGTIKLQRHHDQEEIKQRAGFWGYLMQIIYQTCAGAVILTDIVFWCILVPFLSTLDVDLLMASMHSLNAFFLLVDSSLNRLPFPWFRFTYFVFWSCLYIVFQWILHACGFTWWPYPFLELSTPWAPLWYLSLAVVHIPCYALYAVLIKAKFSVCSRWFPHAFVK